MMMSDETIFSNDRIRLFEKMDLGINLMDLDPGLSGMRDHGSSSFLLSTDLLDS